MDEGHAGLRSKTRTLAQRPRAKILISLGGGLLVIADLLALVLYGATVTATCTRE